MTTLHYKIRPNVKNQLMSQIAQNLEEVRRRIAAAQRAGRDPAAVRLVAVSKTMPLELMLFN